jgi:hypothetical protein
LPSLRYGDPGMGISSARWRVLADPLGEGLKTETMSVRFAHLSFCFPHLVRVNSSHLLQTKCPAKGGDIVSVLRRGRDSNPRKCNLQQFSRLPQ